MRKLLIIILFLLWFHHLHLDAEEVGSRFLKLGVSAREIAMGEVGISCSYGVNSINWNPGCFGFLDRLEFSFMHAEWFQGIRYVNFGFAQPLSFGNIGVGMKGLWLGDIEGWTGPDPEDYQGEFNALNLAVNLSFSKKIGTNKSFGLNLKPIYENIATEKAFAFASDLGFLYELPVKGLKAGLTFQNIGTCIKFKEEGSSLPSFVGVGFSYPLFNESVTIAADILKPFKENLEFRTGVEYLLSDIIAFRFGYKSGLSKTGEFAGLNCGFGAKVRDLNLDYAFAPYGVLGLTHRVSLTYYVGREKEKEEMITKKMEEELRQKEILTAENFYKQGLNHFSQKRFDNAIDAFDLALVWYPDYKGAKAELERAVQEKEKREIQKRMKIGIKDYNENNLVDAIYEFSYVLSLDSTNANAKVWLEASKSKVAEIQTAKAYREAARFDEIMKYFSSGISYYSKGKYRLAISEWGRVLTLDPQHIEAKDYISKANAKMEGEILACLQKANRYIEQQNWELASAELKKVLSLDPGNSQGLSLEKEVRTNLMKAEKERKEYVEKAAKENIMELYLKGIGAYTKDHLESAILYWKKVLEIDPKHKNAKRNIERAKTKLERIKRLK